jgi:hypothetical protein
MSYFFSDLCYFASSIPRAWPIAVEECSGLEGKLATPKTWTEWNQIIQVPNKTYWIGIFEYCKNANSSR